MSDMAWFRKLSRLVSRGAPVSAEPACMVIAKWSSFRIALAWILAQNA